jgi:hypothetical protein
MKARQDELFVFVQHLERILSEQQAAIKQIEKRLLSLEDEVKSYAKKAKLISGPKKSKKSKKLEEALSCECISIT